MDKLEGERKQIGRLAQRAAGRPINQPRFFLVQQRTDLVSGDIKTLPATGSVLAAQDGDGGPFIVDLTPVDSADHPIL